MEHLVFLGLFAPLVGFLFLLLFSSSIKPYLSGLIGSGTVLVSLLSFSTVLYLFIHNHMDDQDFTFYQWIALGDVSIDFKLHVDPLALLMTMIISGIGFLIHVYSNGYMSGERDVVRYFACMNLFVFAMLLLVLSANLVLLFVGWEGVGLASYLLIGFYYEKPAAAAAATKAFVMNRIGDFGFLLGVLLIFQLFGTADINEVLAKAATGFAIGAPVITLLTLLLFVGCMGKSAQFPLHSWLPDAMEGPTPVSALIHAATMVTAGVYLIVRLHPLFLLAPITLQTIGTIGAVTSLFAALCAIGQTDLKKVLAYSTVSQLGLMFVACGAGAFYAAMFHLTTHAFMKSLLFLSAGDVVHAMNGTTEMQTMGGLRIKMKWTNALFLIGALAMSGLPPFAAFFSKDMILEQEYMAGFDVLFYLSLGASILTGVYMFRAYCLTFVGKPRLQPQLFDRLHEAPKIMIYPLFVVAFLSICGGFLGFSFEGVPFLASFLSEVGLNPDEEKLSMAIIVSYETLLAIGGAFFGVLTAIVLYTRYLDRLSPTLQILKQAFYIDEIYEMVIVQPLKALASFIANWIEPVLFAGSINAVGYTVKQGASILQTFQSGQIRSYMAWMVIGMVCIMAYFVF